MKIIAFGGSNSKQSINKRLAAYASSLFENADVEVLDLNDYAMPVFSVDLEKEIGQHEVAKAFLSKLKEADILVVSMAENNGNYSVTTTAGKWHLVGNPYPSAISANHRFR